MNKLKKTATDISDASQPTDDSQVLTHLPTEQTISAEIADLLISHKLDQISPATAAKLLAQAAALENNQSPKLTQAAKPPQAMNPNSTFCTICKKEVCNKYFFKTHLLNKHNITLEDYLAGNKNEENSGSSDRTKLTSRGSCISVKCSFHVGEREQFVTHKYYIKCDLKV